MNEGKMSSVETEFEIVSKGKNLERLTASAEGAGKKAEWYAHVEALSAVYWSETVELLDEAMPEFVAMKSSVSQATQAISANLAGIKQFIAIVGLLAAATSALTEVRKLAEASNNQPSGTKK